MDSERVGTQSMEKLPSLKTLDVLLAAKQVRSIRNCPDPTLWNGLKRNHIFWVADRVQHLDFPSPRNNATISHVSEDDR